MSRILLDASGIRHGFGLRRVLEIDSLRIYDGERIGLIGEMARANRRCSASSRAKLCPTRAQCAAIARLP